MLNTNLLFPTESTELNVFLISAKLFQLAPSDFLHQIHHRKSNTVPEKIRCSRPANVSVIMYT
jgi:hypothetical protein